MIVDCKKNLYLFIVTNDNQDLPPDREYELPLEHPVTNSHFDYAESGSPFHFSPGQHAEHIKKFTNSPGDGYSMSTRSMFDPTSSTDVSQVYLDYI